MSSLIGGEILSKGARKKDGSLNPGWNQLSQPRQPAASASQPAKPAAGGISHPYPTHGPSRTNPDNRPASQPASQRGGWRNQPAMPHTTAISQQPAESVSQPASQPATQPASAAAGGISQPTPTTGGISQPASQPASAAAGGISQ